MILGALADQGWCVTPGFLSDELTRALRCPCLERHAAGEFHAAGIGSGSAKVIAETRGDHIRWLEDDDENPAVQAYLSVMEALRQAVNQTFFLGLIELEAHFAVYPAGAFYKRHLDRFKNDDRRTLTVVAYLNEDWTEADGGMLRFWPDPVGEEGDAIDISPVGGTLVTFFSDRYWHEVLPARRPRLALTGWFTRR